MNIQNQKSLLVVCLLLLLFQNIEAHQSQYSFIYSSTQRLSIKQCIFSDSTTAITIAYSGTPYTSYTFTSSTYACDEQGVRYKVRWADGISLNHPNWLSDDGESMFTLYFDPLPKETQIFDIIEGQLLNGFRIYGIYDSREIPYIPKVKEAVDIEELDKRWFKTDTTVIRGRITNYNRSMPHMIRVEYFSPNIRGRGCDNGLNYAKINADGTFQVAFLLDYPKWTEFSLDFTRYIPFYAHPGDTLDIRIDNYGEWNENSTFTNTKGWSVLNGLMQCDDLRLRSELSRLTNNTSYQVFTDELRILQDKADRLLDYWIWKYRLSSWECHLLKTNWQLRCIMEQENYRKKKTREINRIMERQADCGLFEAPKQLYSRFYLKDFQWEDSSLFMTPAWNESFTRQLRRDGINVIAHTETSVQNEQMQNHQISVWGTYKVRKPEAQSLIDSLVARSDARYSVLLFIEPGKDEDRHLSDFLELRSEFEGEVIHFILVVSKGHSSSNLNNLLSRIEMKCRIYNLETDICIIDEEQMIVLQEAFQSILIPFNATLKRNGEVLCRTLHTFGERPSVLFRELIKNERSIMP